MVADRVQVLARGSNVDMDAIKAAVNGVDFAPDRTPGALSLFSRPYTVAARAG